MAKHIADAFPTVVWNRTRERAESFAAEKGARHVGSPKVVVQETDVVVMSLPTSAIVLEVIESIGEVWREGQLLVDATSGDPSGAREAAAQLSKFGVGFVDAPVSGGT